MNARARPPKFESSNEMDGAAVDDGPPNFDNILDEDGFPSFQHLQDGGGDVEFYQQEDGFVELAEEDEEEEEKRGFAAEFYRCGTDWSCLLLKDKCDEEEKACSSSKRMLKQANLFQIWGLKKPRIDEEASFPIQKQTKRPKSKDLAMSKSSLPGPKRSLACPFYKKIPGTPFTVDAFRYGCVEGCSAYFLTHFHCDHYGGLSKRWSHGPIYCSPLTARLVRLFLYVNPSFIHPLELNTEYVIEGIKVILLEANHCPGAALVHFRLVDGRCYLHTGDFRASKQMQAYPLLLNHRVNVLYLDTTYCNPRYKFPAKEDVLNFVIKVTKNHLKRQPKTLVVVGAYSIGKECVFLSISKSLGVKIYANASRRRILLSFDWPELSGSLSTDGKDTPLHVLPISSLRFETLMDYLKTYRDQYTAVLAFRPTGWTYSESIGNQLDLIRPKSRRNVTIYGVPYSEHSSFTELREFVQFLRPDKIIPTVNVGNAATREKMHSYFRQWLKG